MATPSQPLDDHGEPVAVLAPESTKTYALDDVTPTPPDPYLHEQVIRVHTTGDCWLCLTGVFDALKAMPLNAGTIEYFYIPVAGGVTVLAKPGVTGTLTVTTMV